MPLSRRAILAHELCHLLHDGGERDLTVVSRTDDPSFEEQRANAFAPSFLAPGSWLKLRARSPLGQVRELAAGWGLSFEGAAWHAKNLHKISASECEAIRQRPERVKDPERFDDPVVRTPPELVGLEQTPTALALGRLTELVILAYEDGAISRGRAHEILSLS
jgi:Zn-dependent peptidase ImmA (M78 family)